MTTSIAWGPVFPVNSTIIGDQLSQKIYALKDGSFVAVWTDHSNTGADTHGGAIKGQLFSADGSTKGADSSSTPPQLGCRSFPM